MHLVNTRGFARYSDSPIAQANGCNRKTPRRPGNTGRRGEVSRQAAQRYQSTD